MHGKMLYSVMFKMYVFLTFLLLNSSPATAEQTQVQLCGSNLANVLGNLCNNRYNRPLNHHLDYRKNRSRRRRSIIEECCKRPCTHSELKKYCAPISEDAGSSSKIIDNNLMHHFDDISLHTPPYPLYIESRPEVTEQAGDESIGSQNLIPNIGSYLISEEHHSVPLAKRSHIRSHSGSYHSLDQLSGTIDRSHHVPTQSRIPNNGHPLAHDTLLGPSSFKRRSIQMMEDPLKVNRMNRVMHPHHYPNSVNSTSQNQSVGGKPTATNNKTMIYHIYGPQDHGQATTDSSLVNVPYSPLAVAVRLASNSTDQKLTITTEPGGVNPRVINNFTIICGDGYELQGDGQELANSNLINVSHSPASVAKSPKSNSANQNVIAALPIPLSIQSFIYIFLYMKLFS